VKQRTGWLVALGVLALFAFALVTLPASVLSGPLARAEVSATGFTGSIWSGAAQGLAWKDAVVGDLQWSLAPLRLFTGRLAGHTRLSRPDGSFAANFDVNLAGDDVRLGDVTLALPVAMLDAFPLGMPKGWRGQASGTFAEIHLQQRRPVAVRGTLELDGLIAPPPRNASLGSFLAVFPHPRPQPSLSIRPDPGNLTAQVRDKNGPYAVDAQLTVSPARSFSLEGTLAPRGPVPPAMQQSLQLLGPADAAGRRQFSVGGTL
jgi:general secretion pathway protein N